MVMYAPARRPGVLDVSSMATLCQISGFDPRPECVDGDPVLFFPRPTGFEQSKQHALDFGPGSAAPCLLVTLWWSVDLG